MVKITLRDMPLISELSGVYPHLPGGALLTVQFMQIELVVAGLRHPRSQFPRCTPRRYPQHQGVLRHRCSVAFVTNFLLPDPKAMGESTLNFPIY